MILWVILVLRVTASTDILSFYNSQILLPDTYRLGGNKNIILDFMGFRKISNIYEYNILCASLTMGEVMYQAVIGISTESESSCPRTFTKTVITNNNHDFDRQAQSENSSYTFYVTDVLKAWLLCGQSTKLSLDIELKARYMGMVKNAIELNHTDAVRLGLELQLKGECCGIALYALSPVIIMNWVHANMALSYLIVIRVCTLQ